MQRYLGACILILISVLVSLFYPRANMMSQQSENIQLNTDTSLPQEGEPYSVKWQTLQKLDYKNNKIQDESLQKILNRSVKIPGFAVPLTDNLQAVSEFLFVPNQQACIHVPAPPPNLIVFVRLEKAMKIEDLIGPLWVHGTLRLKTMQSVYGSSSYEMESPKVEPFIY